MTDQPISNRIDRIEASVATHNEIISQLAPLTAQIAQLLAQQTARGDRHDEVLSRLENSVNRQQETLDRHEATLARIERNIEALTTSTTETIQLVAQQAIQSERDRQACLSEIREIWRYLRYEPRNGNGTSEE
ncbi:hypothetical protein NIES4106_58500 (plasmid) [Fischerella sp. NIES-4106]|nr:hypothetical protein NIES4106_58500 [Fischerella sp. NIES-4106]